MRFPGGHRVSGDREPPVPKRPIARSQWLGLIAGSVATALSIPWYPMEQRRMALGVAIGAGAGVAVGVTTGALASGSHWAPEWDSLSAPYSVANADRGVEVPACVSADRPDQSRLLAELTRRWSHAAGGRQGTGSRQKKGPYVTLSGKRASALGPQR